MGDRSTVEFHIEESEQLEVLKAFFKEEAFDDYWLWNRALIAMSSEATSSWVHYIQAKLINKWPEVPWLLYDGGCPGSWGSSISVYHPEYRVVLFDDESTRDSSVRTWWSVTEMVPTIPIDERTGLPDEAQLKRFKRFWEAYKLVAPRPVCDPDGTHES